MDAKTHLLVFVCFSIGFFLSTFLIDLDHTGSLKAKWKCFWDHSKCEEELLSRGIFHEPRVAFSIIALSFGIGIGYLIHILMDYLRFVK